MWNIICSFVLSTICGALGGASAGFVYFGCAGLVAEIYGGGNPIGALVLLGILGAIVGGKVGSAAGALIGVTGQIRSASRFLVLVNGPLMGAALGVVFCSANYASNGFHGYSDLIPNGLLAVTSLAGAIAATACLLRIKGVKEATLDAR